MKDTIVKFFWFVLMVWALFAALDLLGCTGWFIYPIGCFKKNPVCTNMNGQ